MGRFGLAKQEEECSKVVGRRVKRYRLALASGSHRAEVARSGWMKDLMGENHGVTTGKALVEGWRKFELEKLEEYMVLKFEEGMSKGCSAQVNSFYATVLGMTAEVLCGACASAWPRSIS